MHVAGMRMCHVSLHFCTMGFTTAAIASVPDYNQPNTLACVLMVQASQGSVGAIAEQPVESLGGCSHHGRDLQVRLGISLSAISNVYNNLLAHHVFLVNSKHAVVSIQWHDIQQQLYGILEISLLVICAQLLELDF